MVFPFFVFFTGVEKSEKLLSLLILYGKLFFLCIRPFSSCSFHLLSGIAHRKLTLFEPCVVLQFQQKEVGKIYYAPGLCQFCSSGVFWFSCASKVFHDVWQKLDRKALVLAA